MKIIDKKALVVGLCAQDLVVGSLKAFGMAVTWPGKHPNYVAHFTYIFVLVTRKTKPFSLHTLCTEQTENRKTFCYREFAWSAVVNSSISDYNRIKVCGCCYTNGMWGICLPWEYDEYLIRSVDRWWKITSALSKLSGMLKIKSNSFTYRPPTNKLSPDLNISRKWSIADSFPWNLRTSSATGKREEKKRWFNKLHLRSRWQRAYENNCIN